MSENRKSTAEQPRFLEDLNWRSWHVPWKWLLIIPSMIVLLLLLSGFTVVNESEACLLVRDGTIRDQWGPGRHWSFPIGSDATCYKTSRITLEASPGQAGAGADYNDDAVAARSKDGQIIDAVSYRLAFSIPMDRINAEGDTIEGDNLRYIHTTVGAESEDALVKSVISFYARPEVRAVMQLHTSEELLTGDLSNISREIEDRLRPKFAENGVNLEVFIISKPDFNDPFEQKLQERGQAAVDIEIAQQRVQVSEQEGLARIAQAETDKEIAAIKAQSDAEAAAIKSQSDAEAASIKAQGDADAAAIKSQSDAEVTVTRANAEATAIALKIDAMGGAENYLQSLQISAMREWPVQIIGQDAGVPLFDLTQPTPEAGS